MPLPLEWTPEMDALLGTMTDQEAADLLGLSHLTVYYRRAARGVPPFGSHQWTPAEDALVGTMSDREVAERLGLTLAQVHYRRTILGRPAGGKAGRKTIWRPEWDALLGTDTDAGIARRLGVSWSVVIRRRALLGIRPVRRSRLGEGAAYTRARLLDLLARCPDAVVAKKLRVTKQRVSQLRKREGIPKPFRGHTYHRPGKKVRGWKVLEATPDGYRLECRCGRSVFLPTIPSRNTCGRCPHFRAEKKWTGYKHPDGRLTLVRSAPEKGKGAWECKCDCGNTHYALARNVYGGLSRSCGCLLREYWNRNRLAAT